MPRRKPWRWVIPLALVGALGAFAKTMNTSPPTNRAQTSPDAGDDDLRTRVYAASWQEVAAKTRALQLSTYGRRWRITSKEERPLVFRVPVIVFSDLLTVSLESTGENQTRVDVESHSLIGQGDFGENRRHVRQILRALDAVLPRVPGNHKI